MYNKWAKYTHKGITLLCDASPLAKKRKKIGVVYSGSSISSSKEEVEEVVILGFGQCEFEKSKKTHTHFYDTFDRALNSDSEINLTPVETVPATARARVRIRALKEKYTLKARGKL